MKTRVIILILISMLTAFYLELDWLILFLSVTLFLIGLTTIKREKPQTIKVPKQRDVIYPVIYEDVGEPPLLYPEKMKIKVHPDTGGYTSALDDALGGVGNILKAGIKLASGKKKEKEEDE